MTDRPAEPRSTPEAPHLLRTVAETLAHWLPRGGPAGTVEGWTEREWRAAAWLGYWQGASPWILQRAAEDEIEARPEARRRLERAAGLMRARTALLFEEGAEVLAALAGEGIPVVPLKGIVISQRFLSDPGSRPMRDIDLLVAPHDAEPTGRLLQSLGYRPLQQAAATSTWARGEARPETWSPEHIRPIDLHTSAERDIAHLGLDVDRLLWRGSTSGTLLGAPALVPDLSTLLVHTALHASRNLLMANASLSHLRDLEAVGRAALDTDWDELLLAADRVTRRHVHPAIVLLDRYSPGIVPHRVRTALDEAASRRMRTWVERSGMGRETRLDHTVRSASPDAVRAMLLLVQGPREHVRLALPPRGHVLRSHRWAGTPAWPLVYLWRRARSLGRLALSRIRARR
jgi:hypothetical protein